MKNRKNSSLDTRDTGLARKRPLPWELPGAHWIGREELRLVSQVVRARSPFRFYGPDLQHMTDRLERAFAGRLGRKHALGVNSATSGLYIALAALGVGAGDEVLLPGFLWVSCLSAIVRLGAIPRLVDIDDTFCMSPEDLQRKIGCRSKAVLFIHMSGAPGHIDAVAKICKRAGVGLIEDCAQANGASLRGRSAGSFGDIAVFSFQLNKNMSSGEGGMIVCDRQNIYKRCFAMHDLGYARNAAGRLDPSDVCYQFWGAGSRMSELTAAMALAQFGKLNRIVHAMRKAKWRIRRQLAGIPGLEFRNILDPSGDSSPFLITIFRDAQTCRAFAAGLQEEGLRGPTGSLACVAMEQFGLHWYFNNQSLTNRRSLGPDGAPWSHPANAFAAKYNYARGALPVCDDLAARSVLLTIASCLTPSDCKDIVTAYRKVAARVLKSPRVIAKP